MPRLPGGQKGEGEFPRYLPCFLVPAFIREPKSDAVLAWIEDSGDALHLAIAEANKVQDILCLDETMGAVARKIGLNVVSV